jgi:hypothetical protein
MIANWVIMDASLLATLSPPVDLPPVCAPPVCAQRLASRSIRVCNRGT